MTLLMLERRGEQVGREIEQRVERIPPVLLHQAREMDVDIQHLPRLSKQELIQVTLDCSSFFSNTVKACGMAIILVPDDMIRGIRREFEPCIVDERDEIH